MSKSIADIEEIARIDNLKHQISQEIREAENRGSIHITIGMINYKGNYNLLRSDISKVKVDFSNAHYFDDWQITINQFNEVDIIKIMSPLKGTPSLFGSHVIPAAAWGVGNPSHLVQAATQIINNRNYYWISDALEDHEDDLIDYFKEEVIPSLKKSDFIETIDIPLTLIKNKIDYQEDIDETKIVIIETKLNDIFKKTDLKYYGLSVKVIDRQYYYIFRISANRDLVLSVKGDPIRYYGFIDLRLAGMIMDNIDQVGNDIGWIDPSEPDFLATVIAMTGYKFHWAPQMIDYYAAARADLLVVETPLTDNY